MIGIRREDKNDWERRAPLTPDHVHELVAQQGLAVKVQPSERRAFPDVDYRNAGATIDEDLGDCKLILGVKEVPPDRLVPGAAYLFFSHTTKGQAYNMPMLRRLLALGCTLIDYEQIVDDHGERLIFFGRHAGYAGMINTLWALGKRLAWEGLTTPFERVRLAHDYSSLDEATHHVSRIGEELRHRGIPEAMRPIVCGFTGSGNVSLGAKEIFDRLPTVRLNLDELDGLHVDGERPRNVVYWVHFRREQRFLRADGSPADARILREAPEGLKSGVAPWLRHLTLLVHGAYWEPSQPRLVSLDDLRTLWSGERPKLRVLADISCDIDGGIESTVRPTTPGEPVYVYDLDRDRPVDGVSGRGPVVMAVDNLPCQLPTEASQHFGDQLIRFARRLGACDWSQPLEALDLPEPVRGAVIAHAGDLAPRFRGLRDALDRFA